MAKLKNLERLSYPDLVKQVRAVNKGMTVQESFLVARFLIAQWKNKSDFENDVNEGLEVVRNVFIERNEKKASKSTKKEPKVK